jgi:hypothetical protein
VVTEAAAVEARADLTSGPGNPEGLGRRQAAVGISFRFRIVLGRILQAFHVGQAREGVLEWTGVGSSECINGETGYRPGCEALVGHDHGLTWDLKRRCILNAFQYSDNIRWRP